METYYALRICSYIEIVMTNGCVIYATDIKFFDTYLKADEEWRCPYEKIKCIKEVYEKGV